MMTKTLRVLALGALAVGCHLDKLLGGSGGGSPPPSHGTPVGLAFTTPPRSVQAGRPIGPVQVSIVDSAGNPVAGVDTVTVVVTLHDNPGSDTLNGTKNTHPVNGVATFTNLSLDTPGQGYTLEASAGPLNKLSDPFNIMPPPPTTGALTVTTNTPANPPAAGYTVTVNGTGGTTKAIGASGTVTFIGLSAGNHTVTLGDVPTNCTVTGGNAQTVPIVAGDTAAATFTIACTPPPPTTGSITVTTSTSGSDLDPDGYTVTVDGGASQSIVTNSGSSGVTFTNLPATNHSVALSGVAANCTVNGGDTHTVAVSAGNNATTAFIVTCAATTGGLTVTTSTTGQDLDPDGYTVTLDGSTSQAITTNSPGGVTFSGLSPTSHSVALSGIASNCSVSGPNPRTVSIAAGSNASTGFAVTCTAIPTTGSIAVTTTTGGSNLPSGYTVTVDGRTQSVAASGTVTFDGLNVGNHSVGLSPIPSNCSVSGANPQTVAVTAGNTTPATFSISCTAPPQDHPPVVNAGGNQTILFGSVTVNWSFTDPDNDAPWSYSIDWGDGSSLETGTTSTQGPRSASHSYGLNLVGIHNVRVTVTDNHGLSDSDTAVITVVASLP